MKKYEFTGETKTINLSSRTVTLHRIKAVVEFGLVKVGELGGWIEKEENLSHKGDAWVSGDAVVRENAEVSGNAVVSGDAVVRENAEVSGNAVVSGDAVVRENAVVRGNAVVSENAVVRENAEVSGNAVVSGDAVVRENAWVRGNAVVSENAVVRGDAEVSENAWVRGNAVVSENAVVRGNAVVSENAEVFSVRHVLVIGPIGSRNAFTTFYHDKDNEITVQCGCFIGKIDKFLKKVTQTHCDSKYALVYRAAVEVARLQIEL